MEWGVCGWSVLIQKGACFFGFGKDGAAEEIGDAVVGPDGAVGCYGVFG